MTKRQKISLSAFFLGILLIFVLLFVCGNSLAILLIGADEAEAEIGTDDIKNGYFSDGTTVIHKDGYVVFPVQDYKSVYFEWGGSPDVEAKVFNVTVQYRKGSLSDKKEIFYACKGQDLCIPLDSEGYDTAAVMFGQEFTAGKITYNRTYGYRFPVFSILALGLIWLFLCAGWCFEWHRLIFDPKSREQKGIFGALILVFAVISVFIYAFSVDGGMLYEYPLSSVDGYGCYPQLFDAFMKGQTNIDTEYDLSVFETINPYDPTERYLATGERYGVFWDRAYFGGKLYSYFGAAPVILLYFPIYFITGSIPSDAFASLLLAIFAGLFLMLTVWEFSRQYAKQAPFAAVCMLALSVPFGALLLPTLTNANFYHIAVLSALFFTSALLYLFLRGTGCELAISRRTLFALAGLSLGGVAASRPTLVLFVLVLVPLALRYLREKKNGRLIDVTAFALPVLVCAGLLMFYNHSRFGSPFDFGNNYQLTIREVSLYTFKSEYFAPSLYWYFAQPASWDGVFPYLHPSVLRLKSLADLPYLYNTIGSLSIPVTWGSIFTLSATKKQPYLRATAAIAVVSAVFLVYFNTCFGGVHLRYAADIMFILSLLGALSLLKLMSNRTQNGRSCSFIFGVAVALVLLTAAVNIPLCLDNERDMIMKMSPKVFYYFAK